MDSIGCARYKGACGAECAQHTQRHCQARQCECTGVSPDGECGCGPRRQAWRFDDVPRLPVGHSSICRSHCSGPMSTAPGWGYRRVVRYRWPARLALACGSALLNACAVLPPTVERTPSHAIPMTSATALGAMAIASSPHDSRSGFRLLPSPHFAFNARVDLLTRAEQSLDVQYYEILDDESGRQVLRL